MNPLVAFVLLLLMRAFGGEQPEAPHKPEPKPEPEPGPAPSPHEPAPGPAPSPGPSVHVGPAVDIHPTAAPAAAPPAWPQVVPKDLPAFPSGWEPDVPVKSDVAKRAAALIPTLWKSGKPGAKTTEKTGDHWVTYLAFVPKKGKKGVAAYRPKAGASTVMV
jgi:hypothetical protein